MSSAVLHFTHSISLPGTNSYAWSVPSNWEGGTPSPNDQIIVNQPAGATGVSYDDDQLSGGLLSLTVPDQSPLPELESATTSCCPAASLMSGLPPAPACRCRQTATPTIGDGSVSPCVGSPSVLETSGSTFRPIIPR